MIYLVLLEGVAFIATALAFANVIHWMIREQARERQLLINQVMFLSGHKWLEPPASSEPINVIQEELPDVYYAPEQMPDEYFVEVS